MRHEDTNARIGRLEKNFDRRMDGIQDALNKLIQLSTKHDDLVRRHNDLDADTDFRFDKVDTKLEETTEKLTKLQVRMAWYAGALTVGATAMSFVMNIIL